MFEKLLDELAPFEGGVRVPVDIPLDEDGYMDRRCPGEACKSEFKVLFKDWADKVLDERVYCPICRHEAEATEWNTPEQAEYIDDQAMLYLQRAVDRGLEASARAFNRQQGGRSGFIKMSMSVGPRQPLIVVPVSAAEVMQQKFCCEECECQYASTGAAFFCPACGHNSAISTFDQTLATVVKVVEGLKPVRAALAEQFGKDVAQDSVRHMLENTMGRIVGAFQRYAEALFDELPNRSNFKPRRNLFQNLPESSDLWEKAGLPRYETLIGAVDYEELGRLYQQRHLLAHCDGIVDQNYIDRSGDTRFRVGQRLVIREAAVRRLTELVRKLGDELQRQVGK